MKALDRILQRWRIVKVRPFIPDGARVLDIGCDDGALFRYCGEQIRSGVGIDPTLNTSTQWSRFQLVAGKFPEDLPPGEPFDVITLLAVLEHVPGAQKSALAANCARLLAPGGRVLLTVPSPRVDAILLWLRRFRLLDGMSLEEHHGFDPTETPAIFESAGLKLLAWRRFQFGLNNLFVFQKQNRA